MKALMILYPPPKLQTYNQLKAGEAGRTATPHAWAQQRCEWIRV